MGVQGTSNFGVRDCLRMHALSTLVALAMFETDSDGHVSWTNERWCELTGVQSIHALGRSWCDTVHPDDRARVLDHWRVAISSRDRFTVECRLSDAGHDTRWVEIHAAPLVGVAKSDSSYVHVVTEVTERQRLRELARTTKDLEIWAEQSAATLAQQSRELGIFAALVASSADAIAIVEPGETVRYFNAAFRELFAVPEGLDWLQLLTILGVDGNTAQSLRRASATGEMWESMVTLQRPHKGALYAEVRVFSILDATSRRIGLAIVVRDLSAHQEVEAERARLHGEIVAAQALAIRELSTPLLPIGPGILAMPLIGNIDAARGERILETLLEGIREHQAIVAILDVTGVRQINADIADILLRCAHAARLLGARVLLTGVGPIVAKTLIQLGLDLSRLYTLATLEQGIRTAFSHTRSPKGNITHDILPLRST